MKSAIAALALIAVLVCSTTASPQQVLSVCDLIQHPDKWEDKIVTVKGALPVEFAISTMLTGMLSPLPTEHCKYSNSKYISADEPPQIMLDMPDDHFRKSPPVGFVMNDASFIWAAEQLSKIPRLQSSPHQAIVTVEAYVTLRKYNLRELERDVAAKKMPPPVHTLPPVILTLQSYRNVESR
jgi:hypothetical protein